MNSEQHWRADVQGLRGLAVLLVLLFHADLPVPGGFTGVDVFFVVSGYVVTQMIMREYRSAGRVDLRRFFSRRFRRLAPAVGALIAVVLLVTVATGSPFETDARTGLTALGALTLSANFVIAAQSGDYFDAAAELNPLLHLWSLAVEEQFYLVFPLLFITATLGRRRPPRGLAIGVVFTILGAASLKLAFGLEAPTIFSPIAGGAPEAFYLLPARAWEFLVGAILALTPRAGVPAWLLLRKFLASAGVVGLIVGAVVLDPGVVQFPGPWTLLPVLATAAVLSGSGVGPGRALASRPMVVLGNISYSLYLWHWPMVVLAKRVWPDLPAVAVLATVVAVLPAIFSYRYLEAPFRRGLSDDQRRSATNHAAVLVGFVIPLLLSGAFLSGVSRAWGVPVLQEAKEAFERRHIAYSSGCASTMPLAERDLAACWWGQADGARPIVLVGDSNAEHFSGAVIEAAVRLERPALVLIQRGCPFTGAEVARSLNALEVADGGCRRFVAEALDVLSSLEPADIVIAFSDQYWLEAGWSTSLPSTAPATDFVSRLAHLERGLAVTLDAIADMGHRMVYVEAVPHLHYSGGLSAEGFETEAWSIEACSSAALVGGRCQHGVLLSAVTEVQGSAWRTAQRVTESRTETVQYLSVRELLCDSSACRARDETGWLYRDSTHLTVDGASRTTEAFVGALDR